SAVRRRGDPSPMGQERVVRFSLRTVVAVIAVVIAAWALLSLLSITRQVITWLLVALFFAMALNPAVEWFLRHGIKRRGHAVGITFVLTLLAIAAIGYAFIPTLVNNINDFVQAVPGYVDDLTKGKGRFGFLETKYQIVEKIREQIDKGGASRV